MRYNEPVIPNLSSQTNSFQSYCNLTISKSSEFCLDNVLSLVKAGISKCTTLSQGKMEQERQKNK